MASQELALDEFVNSIDPSFSQLLLQALSGSGQDKLWSLLCDKVEEGDPLMKSNCLRLIEQLLNTDIWPGTWTFYLVDLLFALYELITEEATSNENENDLLDTGRHLSSLMAEIATLLQGDYMRMLTTPFLETTPSKLVQWFDRSIEVIAHQNFVKLSLEIRRGILEFIVGVCRILNLCEQDDVVPLAGRIAAGVTKFCACSFSRLGNPEHVSKLLGSFIDVSSVACSSSGENRNFFLCLSRYNKDDFGDTDSFRNMVADAVPFDDDPVSNLSSLLLNAVIGLRGINLKGVFYDYSGQIIFRLIRRLLNHISTTSTDVQSIVRCYFEKAALLFGFCRPTGEINLEYWLQKSLQHIIPALVLSPCSSSSDILRAISKVCGTNRQNLIGDNICHILVKIALKGLREDELKKVYEFIEKEGTISNNGQERRLTFNQYVGCNVFLCVYELLMHLAACEEKIVNMIVQISDLISGNVGKSFASNEKMRVVEFVRPRLIGVLLKFTRKFSGRFPFDEKLLALRSLVVLMKMCAGDVLSEISTTMISTLRAAAAIDDDRIKHDAINAWFVFFTNISSSKMKETVVPVFIGIVPFLPIKSQSTQIVEPLLRFIFVDQNPYLQEQITDIWFVSKGIESELLTQYVPAFDESTYSLKGLLEIGLRLLKNEHPDAKCLSLKRLRSLLCLRSSEANKMILESDNVDEILRQLVTALTLSLHHPDINVRRLAALCMGDLGAVDPGRLRTGSLLPTSAQVDVAFLDFENMQSDTFPRALFCEVTRLLLGASDSFYDVCSWVLQELLKFFDCREWKDQEKTLAHAIWYKLDDSTQKILMPYLSTHYKVDPRPVDLNRKLPNPLFGTVEANNFKQWLTVWISILIAQMKHPRAKELMLILKEGACLDVNFAQFLLPHVVLCRIVEGNEQERASIRTEMLAALAGTASSGEALGDLHFERCSAHVVFCVLDFLYKWTLRPESNRAEFGRKHVQAFIDSIPKDIASIRAAAFGSFPRSLMYYESHMATDKPNSDTCNHFRRLQEIYANMDNVDGVVGSLVVLKKAGQCADKEQALALEATGNYTEALPFWEAAASSDHGDGVEKMKTHIHLINCLLRLNQTGVCERYLSDLSRTSPDWDNSLHPYRVEALLKLQQWGDLENELNSHTNVTHSWPSDVGNLLTSARSRDTTAFGKCLDFASDHVLEKLRVATRDNGTSDGGYNYLLRLHMLSEIEQGARYLSSPDSKDDCLDKMLVEWDQRLKIVQPSPDVLYSLLDLRKQILRLGSPSQKTEKAVGFCWLEAAKVARKTGHYQSAWSFLVKAKEFGLLDTFVEEAKLLWNKDEKVEAISSLKLGIARHYSDLLKENASGLTNVSEERKFSFAKAQLLFANYCRESSSMDTEAICRLYTKATAVYQNWEESYYYAGLHYDQYLQSLNTSGNGVTSVTVLIKVLDLYAKALRYGSQYVHHAMPRLLTMWLDSTQLPLTRGKMAGSPRIPEQLQKSMEEAILKLNNYMGQALGTIPTFQFYCCFSQLISRICHPCGSTYQLLKDILSKLLAQYPRQCVWMIISVKRSSVTERSRRCKEIIQHARERNPEVETIFANVDKLAELLIGVCEKSVEPPSTTSLSLQRDFKQLYNYFKNGNSENQSIILPLQTLMHITYPSPTPGRAHDCNHKPFNERPVYIVEFLDNVEIFPTLQKPKRISLRGSDGQEYSMLCKARDDLRLDKRLMEFTNLVNGCMLRDPEARRRELHIRTYTVTPLNEKCGLLEWVPNLDAMRNIYLRLCRDEGKKPPTLGELRSFQCKVDDPFEKKLNAFQKNLLPKHPLMLKYWFPRTFPDPMAWYRARTNFTRTAAVMSMVGFVLGLGDRHGENILLDRTCGDVVHVDFNCLFNRGESLEYPEVVPFRLTRNMVDAMGPLGYEGPFRKTCEVVMKLMRKEAGMLRTVLETFLHDPLVEWQQQGTKLGSSRAEPKPRPESGEDKAKSHLDNIDGRLRGRVKQSLKEPYGLPLSVEGQVNVLIQQATDEKLLAQMYLGWGPFI